MLFILFLLPAPVTLFVKFWPQTSRVITVYVRGGYRRGIFGQLGRCYRCIICMKKWFCIRFSTGYRKGFLQTLKNFGGVFNAYRKYNTDQL